MPTRTTRHLLAWGAFALALCVAPWLWTSSLALTLLSQMGIAIIVCLSFNMLLGHGGMLSFGHAVYSGMGSFLAIHTLNLVSDGTLPLPVSLLPVAGGLGAALLALLLGWVTTRKAGTTFAMITLGVGELVWAMALMFPGFFGGESGISGNRVAGPRPLGISLGPQIQLYYLIAAYTLGCAGLMYLFTRTPLGRLLNAVRDNPERVAFLGFDPRVVRYITFVISAFFAGISGGLAALNFEIVTTEVLSAHRSGAYLLFTFLGGSTWFAGPVIGAVVMVLATVLLSGYTQAWLLYLGLSFLVMVMVAPGGLASLVVGLWRLLARGGLNRLAVPGGLWLLAGLLALAGAAAMIEMVYHLQLSDELGDELHFLGVALHARSAASWGGALGLLVLGGGLWAALRPLCARRWAECQASTTQEGT